MEWKLSDDRPIFQQLYEQLSRHIVSGRYPPGERMPSVRELAGEAGVNPNTMQRALSQLESSGLAESNRTSGRVVTTDLERIQAVRRELARSAVREYLAAMETLGYDRSAAAELLRDTEEKGGEEA